MVGFCEVCSGMLRPEEDAICAECDATFAALFVFDQEDYDVSVTY